MSFKDTWALIRVWPRRFGCGCGMGQSRCVRTVFGCQMPGPPLRFNQNGMFEGLQVISILSWKSRPLHTDGQQVRRPSGDRGVLQLPRLLPSGGDTASLIRQGKTHSTGPHMARGYQKPGAENKR